MNRKYILQAILGKNELWRYLVVSVMAIAGYFIGFIPLRLVLLRLEYDDNGIDAKRISDFIDTMDFSIIDLGQNTGFLLTLCLFVFALLFLIVGYLIFHKRSLKSLITSSNRIRWKRVSFGFFFWLAMTAIIEYILYVISPEFYTFSFNLKKFIPLVVLSVFILPIQTSFEEIFFRGYLMQGLGSVLNYPIFSLIITSLAFAAVHGSNPEISEFGFGIMMTYYIGAGLLLGLVTILDDGLELALGMHFSINFFGALFMGYTGAAIQTDSLFKISELNVIHMVIAFYVMAIIFVLVCNKIFNWKDWQYLITNNSQLVSDLKQGKALEDDLQIDYSTIL